MRELYLRAKNFRDETHWRWLLTDPDGAYLADHEVALDRDDLEYPGFVDLAWYLQERAVPDRRPASEATLVDQVSGWIGRRVLGEELGRILVDSSPVVVHVIVPREAEVLLYRPLELAHVGGVPLARRDVALILEVEGEAEGKAKEPIGERLRILAAFSLPSRGGVLAVRRERYALTRLVRRVAGRSRRAIELYVLQYGVIRERLEYALSAYPGWDVVHFSGHGLANGLVLEHDDGTSDLVDTADLVELLRPARARLKLITLSSCLSAASSAVAARRTLALDVPGDLEAEATAEASAPPLSGLARELVRRLDCAVLAMRFSVVDDFAVNLNEQLYAGLLDQGQPLPRAVQLAVPKAAGKQPSLGAPAISVGTPALFGPQAAQLSLRPPPGQPSFNVGTSKVAYFPREPERFVGRAGTMARASMVLAPENRERRNTVLFHGMAGAGKTACALELAYRHEQAFGALAWWQAPEQGRDIATSLLDLAMALENQLEDFAMVHAVGSERDLRRFLPRLTQLLEDQAILVVLDNVESLLTDAGRWRDPNWQILIDALAAHEGESRLVLTSRMPLAGLNGRVLVEPVHALSLDEALLLASELPHLGALLRQDQAATGWEAEGRELVRRVLQVVQGHPKLLELADAEAADPTALRERLAQANAMLPGQADRLAQFFTRGRSQLTPEHFVSVLAGWTRGAASVLPEGARTLLWFLCALEEPDRWQFVLEANWTDLWHGLDRPGDPPALDQAMAPLADRALVEVEQADGGGPLRYRIHPGVAEAARAEAGAEFQAAVDAELAAFWQAIFWRALETVDGEASDVAVRAGRGAVPYLLRLEDWEAAGMVLERVLHRDRTPATLQLMLPLLRLTADATRGTDQELAHAGILARALARMHSEDAEQRLREVLDQAVAQGRFEIASAAATHLVDLLRNAGRLAEALDLAEQQEDFTRRAGLGRWSQLSDRAQRLQVLKWMGRDEDVLAEVQSLLEELRTLPETGDQPEAAAPWMIREGILEIGGFAARGLGRWAAALELNREAVRSRVARGAYDLELAKARYNDYAPLLNLGRIGEARDVLLACRSVFEAEGDVGNLGKVFSALAEIEDHLGRQDEAVRFEQTAMRYKYVVMDEDDVGISHFNLANYLLPELQEIFPMGSRGANTFNLNKYVQLVHQGPAALAHRLASVLIAYASGSGRLDKRLWTLARDIEEFRDHAPIPESFAALCEQVEQVEGVRFADLVSRMLGAEMDGDRVLSEVLRLVRQPPEEPSGIDEGALESMLEESEPVIAAVVQAVQGDYQARFGETGLEPLLAELDNARGGASLAATLRRILAGERGQDLLAELDEVDTAIVSEVLRRLGARP